MPIVAAHAPSQICKQSPTWVDGRVNLDAQQLVARVRVAGHDHPGNNALGDAERVATHRIPRHQDGVLQQGCQLELTRQKRA